MTSILKSLPLKGVKGGPHYKFYIIHFTLYILMFLPSCQDSSGADDGESLSQRFSDYRYHQEFDKALALIDSCDQAGLWYPERCHYDRGIIYVYLLKNDLAEQEYRKGIEATKTGVHDHVHVLACYRELARLLCDNMDWEGAMRLAMEAHDFIDALKSDGIDTPLDSEAYLDLVIGETQAKTGNLEGAEKSFQVMWRTFQKMMDEQPDSAVSYVIVNGLYGVLQGYYSSQTGYAYMFNWFDIFDEALARYSPTMNSEDVGNIRFMRLFYEMIAQAETGHTNRAAALYEEFVALPQSHDSISDVYKFAILRRIGRYQEAADYFDTYYARVAKQFGVEDRLDVHVNNFSVGYQLYRKTGQTAKALQMADSLAAKAELAIAKIRNENSARLATIYDTQGKERQIAEQQTLMSKQRTIALLVVLVLMTTFFIIYSLNRRRHTKRLAAAHEQLETAHAELLTAYDKLEETTTAKERIESELRIARDIQMSMVPNNFPQYEGLDMYAEMIAAKEVGGDLYGYVLQGNKLHFCLGDVSGKGVPASLFMSQSARLFRTLATEGMAPVDIAVRMNNELAENNDRGMFVTMFIGMVHLDTGRLDFCNCGHNPPVIDGEFLKMEYDNQPLGLWEDDPFIGETIDDIRGCQLLIYTDGLNEAENRQQELLGNERLLELMADTRSMTSHEVIDMLKAAVEQHRDGADPNDDLTLMCIQLRL